jgi:hypothetical protein
MSAAAARSANLNRQELTGTRRVFAGQTAMNIPALTLTAVIVLLAAAYAHMRIGRFTAGNKNVAFTHALLAAVGLGLGVVGAIICADEPMLAVFALVIGFGIVHVPAALILFFKGQGHASKS